MWIHLKLKIIDQAFNKNITMNVLRKQSNEIKYNEYAFINDRQLNIKVIGAHLRQPLIVLTKNS